jgi:hypothetical protein
MSFSSSDPYHQARCAARHASIKGFYLKKGNTLADWQIVAQNPTLFNRVWRMMLGIPSGDMPPPVGMRP